MTEPQTHAASAPGGAPTVHEQDPQRARSWLILAVIGLAQLMIVLDVTIVNIALPDAQKALGFSNGDRQWIITAYSLAFGSLLLLFGRISDLIGRRTTFLVGLVSFGAASFLGGISPNFEVLVLARALQGAAGAILAPAALSLLTTTFTEAKERATAFAVFGGISGSASAIGLLLGGALTEYLDWRWTLFVNVGIAVVAICGAATLVPRQNRSAQRPALDLPGAALISAGLFGIVYGFSNAESRPWSAPSTWGFLAAGIALIAVFAGWQLRAPHPLLPLRVLRDRNRAGSFLAVFIIGVGMFGVFLFLTYYLQEVLRYSPVETGLAFVPMVAALLLASVTTNIKLLPRFGPKILAIVGMTVAAGGMVWLTRIGLDSVYGSDILGPLLIVGLGIGAMMGPSMNTATRGVQPSDAGVASATVQTMQQIGGSVGTSLLNSLAASALASYLVGRAPTAINQANAAIHSYTTAFWWAAGIFAAGAVICGLLLRPGPPAPADPDTVPAVHA
jgi:EmrB/QacA subfamily drug resistance transporter